MEEPTLPRSMGSLPLVTRERSENRHRCMGGRGGGDTGGEVTESEEREEALRLWGGQKE